MERIMLIGSLSKSPIPASSLKWRQLVSFPKLWRIRDEWELEIGETTKELWMMRSLIDWDDEALKLSLILNDNGGQQRVVYATAPQLI